MIGRYNYRTIALRWAWLAIQKTQMRKAWKNCTGGRLIDGETCPSQYPLLIECKFLSRGARFAALRARVICAVNPIMLECASFQARKDNQNENCHLCPRKFRHKPKREQLIRRLKPSKSMQRYIILILLLNVLTMDTAEQR